MVKVKLSDTGEVDDLLVRGLSLDANLSFIRSTILENNFVASVGRNWVRIPKIRATATLTYAPTPVWSLSTSYRYTGRQYNELDNTDVNPDVYGGTSRARELSVRGLWRVGHGLELALGVDNLTDGRSYQSHPFTGRTIFAEARHAY